MSIRTKRWDDPRQADDGTRILITCYRPRGLRKADETWDVWLPHFGPSNDLHAAVYGKRGRMPINWSTYRSLYLNEMLRQRDAIRELAERVRRGETITLLYSSACVRESRCHRSLLKELIEGEVAKLALRDDILVYVDEANKPQAIPQTWYRHDQPIAGQDARCAQCVDGRKPRRPDGGRAEQLHQSHRQTHVRWGEPTQVGLARTTARDPISDPTGRHLLAGQLPTPAR